MTIDDHSSIYVGGLPYDISDDTLSRAFDIFGAVIAIKIVNDHVTGGKCYGFVTFANPRSATQAIREMDGKTIGGRVVRVNEVKTRPNLNRDNSRRDMERDSENDGRKRPLRDPSYDRHRNRDVRRERFEDYERETGRGYQRVKDRYVEEDRFRGNDGPKGDVGQGRGRKRDRDWERDINLNGDGPRNNGRQTSVEENNQFRNRPTFSDDRSRERSMESLNADKGQVENQLAVSDQKLEELQKEITRLEDWSLDKNEEVSQLHEKRQELEDSLRAAKKITSHRHMQLEKLHKCYLQVRDYDKRLKEAEHDLQLLVDETRTELELEGV